MKKGSPQKKKGKQPFTIYWPLMLGLILFITFSLYSGIGNYSFINYDDDKYVVQNADIRDVSPAGIRKIFLNPQDPGEIKPPLTVVSFAVNYHFSELDPAPYFYTNFILHLINIALVFFLVQRVTKNKWASVFVSAVFALHPSNAEAVAWVSSRKEVLYAFFYLSALWLILQFWNSRKWYYYLPAVVLFFLAFFSKFSAATFPILYIALALFWKHRKDYFRLALESVPFLILPFYSLFMAISRFGQEFLSGSDPADLPFTTGYASFNFIQKLFLGGYSFVAYLLKYLLPFNQQLLYPYPPIRGNGYLPEVYYWVAAIAVLIIAGAAYLIYIFRKSLTSPVVFGLVFFAVHISILLQVLPIGGRVVIADRYTYLPFIGLSILVFFALKELGQKFSRKNTPVVIGAGYLILLTLQLHKRIPDWENTETVFADMIEKEPGYPVSYNNLANAYVAQRQYQQAIPLYNKAIQLDSLYLEAYNNRASAYYSLGQDQKAIENLRRVLKISPAYNMARLNMGKIYDDAGNLDSALFYYKQVIAANPAFSLAWHSAGVIYMRKKSYEEAAYHLKESIRINPHFAIAHVNYGITLIDGFNDLHGALASFDQALEADPNLPVAYHKKAGVYMQLKDYPRAIQMYSTVVQRDPRNVDALMNRGQALIQTGRIAEACLDFQAAQRLGYSGAGELINRYCRN